jgi:enoyl-CoA hydratase/carnithine racemase
MLAEVEKIFTFTAEEKKEDVILKNKDGVFYLFLNRKANSFTHDFVRLINKKLDEVEKHDGPTALVTISLSKFFSGGLDLKYATNLPQ